MAYCEEMIKKRPEDRELKEMVKSSQAQLKYRMRKDEEGYFRASTPSSKALTTSAPCDATNKKGVRVPARCGQSATNSYQDAADEVIDLIGEFLSSLAASHRKGSKKPHSDRGAPAKPESSSTASTTRSTRLPEEWRAKAPRCSRRAFRHTGRPLCTMSTASPWGAVAEMTSIPFGSLIDIFHRLARVPRSRHGNPEGSLPVPLR